MIKTVCPTVRETVYYYKNKYFTRSAFLILHILDINSTDKELRPPDTRAVKV